uniref:Uncharacterized protein n=1 Tax=Medicago truncatula TaxID=3880 RepID=Q1RUA3_MEDTR|nr:hypothetical protein MtrDRAFT_AC153123g46v2 [Medicago truncatula]
MKKDFLGGMVVICPLEEEWFQSIWRYLQDNVANSFIWTEDQVASFTVNCSYGLLSRLVTEVDTDCDFVAAVKRLWKTSVPSISCAYSDGDYRKR